MKIKNNTQFNVIAVPLIGPENANILTIIVKGTFNIISEKKATIFKNQIPIFFSDELNESGKGLKFESDLAPYKPRADIVLVGSTYSKKPVLSIDASLRVNDLVKTIRVFGDRKWNALTGSPTKPESFTKMNIVYERAYGGIDEGEVFLENLSGMGFTSHKSKKDKDLIDLPNIENPQNLINSLSDRPSPVGFGFIEKSWNYRREYIGTYDEKWQKEKSPDFPDDFKFDFYNAAHPDLQMKTYLNGDEEITLTNLTKSGFIHFYLSGVKLDCIVEKNFDSIDSKENLQKIGVQLNLDTLCFIPDEEKLYTVWRGFCEIKDLTVNEIKTVQINLDK